MNFIESELVLGLNVEYVKIFHTDDVISDKVEGKDCIGVISDGNIAVYSMSLEGKEVLLNTLSKNDCFGISNLFTACSLQTTLIAKKTTTIKYILKETIIKEMETNPSFAIKYASYCNEKIQFLLEKIEFLTVHTSKNKLIFYFLSHMDDNKQVRIDCTREELAERLGISRAALFREISYLQKHEVIEIHKNYFEIKDKIKKFAYDNAET